MIQSGDLVGECALTVKWPSGYWLRTRALQRLKGHANDSTFLGLLDQSWPVLEGDAVVPPVVCGVSGGAGDGHDGLAAAESLEEIVCAHKCVMTDSLSFGNRFSGVLPAEKVFKIRGMSEPDPKDVGKRLRAIMLDPELALETVEDFARLLGAERSAASAWVNGYNLPRVPSMARLIDCYPGLTLDWLYLGVADAVPVKVFIKLQALLEQVSVPMVLEEPEAGFPAKAKRRQASRKRATGQR
jgi:transcriptional regulator with XRE-family HTH domain